jgi:hypothetical protein
MTNVHCLGSRTNVLVFGLPQLASCEMSYSCLLLLLLLTSWRSVVVIVAGSSNTTNNSTKQCTSADIFSSSIPRVKFPDCVVAGNQSVIVTHYITDRQTASYPGEFNLQVEGDWGDGSAKVSDLVEGIVGGQNKTTEWSHTYQTAGKYTVTFSFSTVQQQGGAPLSCLSLANSDTRTNAIAVENAGPKACAVVPTPGSGSSGSAKQVWDWAMYCLTLSAVILASII